MKVFDATALIAFLSDMKFPEGLTALSKHYRLVIPEGVVAEVKKSPGKQLLRDLAQKNIVKIEKVDNAKTLRIQNEYPQLHLGECAVIAFAESQFGLDNVVLLSDDRVARKKFQNLNFKWTEEVMEHMRSRNIIDQKTFERKINDLRNSTFYHKGRRKQ